MAFLFFILSAGAGAALCILLYSTGLGQVASISIIGAGIIHLLDKIYQELRAQRHRAE